MKTYSFSSEIMDHLNRPLKSIKS